MFQNIILPVLLAAVMVIAVAVVASEVWHLMKMGTSLYRDVNLDAEVIRDSTVSIMAALTIIVMSIICMMLWRVLK